MLTTQSTNTGRKIFFFTAAAFLLLALFVPELLAQEGGDAGGGGGGGTSLFTMVRDGGWAMYPLGALSIMWVALVVYNFLQLNAKKFAPPELKASLMEQMGECRVRSAIETAADSPSYLGRMMATALPHVDATEPEKLGRDSVDDAVAEFTVKENRGYMASITYFSILSQASPMLGLLGTVSGMIKAFSTLGREGMADPSALAGNISEALVTTATGLIIALPALFAFFYFKNRLQKLVADCHTVASDAMDVSVAAVNAEQQFAKVPEGLQA